MNPVIPNSKISTKNQMSDHTVITKPALRRLLYKAGVVRVSLSVYDELRFMTREVLTSVIIESLTFMKAENRKTLSYNDVCNAMELRGITVVYAPNRPAKKSVNKAETSPNPEGSGGPTVEQVKPVVNPVKKVTESVPSKAVKSTVLKKHRFRAGTVALRQIRREQKTVGFSIPPTPFSRIVAEICHESDPDTRVSRDARMVLQHIIESYIISLCRMAQTLALHAKRQAIHKDDIQLVRMCCHSKLVAAME